MQLPINYTETADIETSSDDYAQRFSGEIGLWFLKVQEEVTLKMISPWPGATILDVGGGHGQLTGSLIDNGYRVSVLGSAEVCKKRIQEFIDRGLCEFTTGNIIELPYPDKAFDIVISFRLLPHVTKWKQLIRELTRVARRAVVVDYPSKQSINCISSPFFRLKKRLEGNTRPFTLFSESDLLEVLKLYGFVYAERYPEFFLPMVLHRVLKLPYFSSFAEKICRISGLTQIFGSPVVLKVIRGDLKL
ncbi:MAG: class I SAM-dependent methyltransferase [Candidatus Dadabacteria bacterium]